MNTDILGFRYMVLQDLSPRCTLTYDEKKKNLASQRARIESFAAGIYVLEV